MHKVMDAVTGHHHSDSSAKNSTQDSPTTNTADYGASESASHDPTMNKTESEYTYHTSTHEAYVCRHLGYPRSVEHGIKQLRHHRRQLWQVL